MHQIISITFKNLVSSLSHPLFLSFCLYFMVCHNCTCKENVYLCIYQGVHVQRFQLIEIKNKVLDLSSREPSKGQFSSVTQLCPILCNLMDYSTPGFPVHHQLLELTQTHVHRVGDDMSIESVMPSNHLILCRPLLLLPSIFPSIGVFSSESVLHIRWPKY